MKTVNEQIIGLKISYGTKSSLYVVFFFMKNKNVLDIFDEQSEIGPVVLYGNINTDV